MYKEFYVIVETTDGSNLKHERKFTIEGYPFQRISNGTLIHNGSDIHKIVTFDRVYIKGDFLYVELGVYNKSGLNIRYKPEATLLDRAGGNIIKGNLEIDYAWGFCPPEILVNVTMKFDIAQLEEPHLKDFQVEAILKRETINIPRKVKYDLTVEWE